MPATSDRVLATMISGRRMVAEIRCRMSMALERDAEDLD